MLKQYCILEGDSVQKMKQHRSMTKRKRSESPEQHKDKESLREQLSTDDEDERYFSIVKDFKIQQSMYISYKNFSYSLVCSFLPISALYK